jgi:hypothetical protein
MKLDFRRGRHAFPSPIVIFEDVMNWEFSNDLFQCGLVGCLLGGNGCARLPLPDDPSFRAAWRIGK